MAIFSLTLRGLDLAGTTTIDERTVYYDTEPSVFYFKDEGGAKRIIRERNATNLLRLVFQGAVTGGIYTDIPFHSNPNV